MMFGYCQFQPCLGLRFVPLINFNIYILICSLFHSITKSLDFKNLGFINTMECFSLILHVYMFPPHNAEM